LFDLLSSSNFGRRFGNLLSSGALHFSPEGPEVTSLIEYLNSTTTSFSSMVHHTHTSEKTAIDYIQNNLEEYALALIVLPEPGIFSSTNIQYKIRQNYTTLPNTNRVVNWISIGLDTEYQMYLLSGFLTLQKTIDMWAFRYSQEDTSGFSDSTNNVRSSTSSSTSSSSDSLGEQPFQSQAEQRVCTHPEYWSMPYPTAAFDQNIFFQAVGFLLGLAMISELLDAKVDYDVD
jgi:hypothetical protein